MRDNPSMKLRGQFEVQVSAEPPFDTLEGVKLGRMQVKKKFSGPLDAESTVEMLSVLPETEGSGAYVAIERIVGSVDGKRGSFAVIHTGVSQRGAQSLVISIVPDSGTGELCGIVGGMVIDIVDGQHHYKLDYALPSA